MKAIISWNEEYLDLAVAKVINADAEEAVKEFYAYVKDRAASLLDITAEEAETLMNDDADDDVNYSEYGADATASIRFGDYTEYLKLADVQAA